MKRNARRHPAVSVFSLPAALGFVALSPACAPEGKPADVDREPPTSGAYLSTSGAEMLLGPEGRLLGGTQATVRLQMSESGRIYYTQDGSEPDPDTRNTGRGGEITYLTLNRDTELRWIAEDLAGNREATGHRTLVRFDHVAPDVTIEPRPVSGSIFPGPITVTVRASEPVTIYYRTDGGVAVAGDPRTLIAQDSLDLPIAHRTSLSIRVVDEARNQWGPQLFLYQLDDIAPVVGADPGGGAFLKPLSVEPYVDDPSATLHFTLDGSTPDENAPVWMMDVEGAFMGQVFDRTTTLSLRAVDPGGNWSETRVEEYIIGPLGARSPTPVAGAERVDLDGNLWLAAALMQASGHASGGVAAPGRAEIASELWGIGRSVADSVLQQSHGGHGPTFAPLNIDRAGSAQASPDRGLDGSHLDDTLRASLGLLAGVAGDTVPAGLYPLVLPYRAASALLLREQGTQTRTDGLPISEDDYSLSTWQSSAGADRNHTADGFHAAMAALAARSVGATAAEHLTDESAYTKAVDVVLGQRCVSCHLPGGTLPDLTDPSAVIALASAEGAAADGVLAILAGEVEHASQPLTFAQRSAVAAWVAAGFPPPDSLERAPGLTAREGFLGLLAAQQATWLLDWAGRSLAIDPNSGRLNSLGTNGVRYVPAELRATTRELSRALPLRPESFAIIDPQFDLGVQARGLGAALQLADALEARADLLDASLIGAASAHLSAAEYARNSALLLTSRTWDAASSTSRSTFTPGVGVGSEVSAAALGDLLSALALARAHDLVSPETFESRVVAARAALAGPLTRADQWYRESAAVAGFSAPSAPARPSIVPHLAVLQGLLALGATGDDQAMEDALVLWSRLDAFWDPEVSAWQTSLGDRIYVYSAALAARGVSALDAAARAGLPDAEARLAGFLNSVVIQGLLASETWVTGEVGSGPDDDDDGVSQPGLVPVANGVAPSFRREVRFE